MAEDNEAARLTAVKKLNPDTGQEQWRAETPLENGIWFPDQESAERYARQGNRFNNLP